MNENKIMQQISAIFSVFMVIFYIGVGTFLIFLFDESLLDKPIRVIIGSTFIFYGLFRAFKAYVEINKLFFSKNQDED
jgi:uncharacterized membrane protein